MELTEMTLSIEQQIDVSRPIHSVFEGLLQMLSSKMTYPDGRSMNMHIERRPGGRWYRELGNDTGHLWGFVQVIKPPSILELSGPMFMSYPAVNHLEFRLTEIEGGARIAFRHRAIGLLEEAHRTGVKDGWKMMFDAMKKELES